MTAETGVWGDSRGHSASSSGPSNPTIEIQQESQPDHSEHFAFLDFIHLIEQFRIPIVDPCVVDPQQRSETAVGILGKGGQYVVDRTYGNQRYPNQRGLATESNTVYKRIIWSKQHQEADTIHHTSQLQAFLNEVKVMGHLRSSPHIINLIGVAWERDTQTQLNPVLALEFAQHNSLVRFMADDCGKSITFLEKKSFITDITEGLHHIHEADFAWGDCKPDNVLICQDENDPTSLKAKISDFGLSVCGSSDSARFRGFSTPWLSPEAHSAIGMTAIKQSEVYSLGLVMWSVLLNGEQFYKSKWSFNGPLDIEDSGAVAGRQIFALTQRGELQNIVITSLMSSMASNISEVEILLVSDIVRQCLSAQPDLRPSVKAVCGFLNRESERVTISKYVRNTNCGEFDMEWLTATFGPTTRLQVVSEKIIQQLETLANDTSSVAAEYQLSLCYATAFGCQRDLHTAIQHMRTCAILGHEKAHDLHLKLTGLAKNFKEPSNNLPAENAPLIDLWDDFGHYHQKLPSQDPPLSVSHIQNKAEFQKGSSIFKGKQRAYADFPLHSAVMRGDPKDVEALLSYPECDINQRNLDQETALLCSIRTGQSEIFEALLRAGADSRAIDAHNRTILHWLATLRNLSLQQTIALFKTDDLPQALHLEDLVGVVSTNPIANETAPEVGTPLDWAVNVRNVDAVRYLISIMSDPAASSSGTSALHRAASRHDCEILALLLKNVSTETLMRFDKHGRSPLACILQNLNMFDRLILNDGSPEGSEQILRMLSGKGHDLSRLNIVTESGESAVYHALRFGHIDRHLITCFWHWDWDEKNLNVVPEPTGPNLWSAFRRALYCGKTSSFELMCDGLSVKVFKSLLNEMSPDGLTIFHELAFLPIENAKSLFNTIATKAALRNVRMRQKRMKPRGSRPRMTPFQLAVLCGKTELANLYIACKKLNPLSGLDRSRFLGFIIEYPCLDPYVPSTWLSLMLDDPVIESTRRFPHPTGMECPLRYLLKHDEAWWRTAKANNRYFKIISEGPSFDSDVEHDPFLSWTPNYITALQFDSEGEQNPAVVRYGADGAFDNNTLGWGHRLRHTLDYGSFLLRLNLDTQKYDSNGHPYITALELGLTVALKSEYKAHAEKNFSIMSEHYHGPKYCNFPYYQYLPTGRTPIRYLRRRETLLHRAIRHGNVNLVNHLLASGADCQMANTQWQTPLHLARLMDEDKDPDARGNHGMFLGRVGLGISPAIPIAVNPEDAPSKRIRWVLEQEAIKANFWSLPQFRALREVKWPWDEYETDDLGLRFVLFHLATLTIVMGLLTLLVRLTHFGPAIGYVLGSIGHAIEDMMLTLRDCYVGSLQNGSDPHTECTYLQWGITPVGLDMLIPAINHQFQTVLDVFDDCYDNSTNSTNAVYSNADSSGEDNEVFLPGCLDEDFLDNDSRFEKTGLELDTALYNFLQKECGCSCTWFGNPKSKAKKPSK